MSDSSTSTGEATELSTSSPTNNTASSLLEPLPLPSELETSPEYPSSRLRQLLHERQKQQSIWESEIVGALAVLQTQKNVGMSESLVDHEGFPRDDVDVYAVRQARNTVSTRRNDLKKLGDELKILLEAIFAVLAREQQQQQRQQNRQQERPEETHDDESIEERNMKRFEQRRRERMMREEEEAKAKRHHGNANSGEENDNNNSSSVTRTASTTKREQDEKVNKIWTEAGAVPICIVRDIAPNSPAFVAGFLDGDIVVAIGEEHGSEMLLPEHSIQPLLNLADVASVIKKSEGKSLRVIVRRSGNKTPAKNNNFVECILVPKRWSGNGILGCGLDPI